MYGMNFKRKKNKLFLEHELSINKIFEHILISISLFVDYFFFLVIPIWKEPIPGWTDNINGPTGLLIGAGKGVIRTMYCNNEGYADYLPVDIAVNGIILGTWNYIENE